MTIELYNTRTRRKEKFEELVKGKVSIYSCGPTVYSFQHIGNMRSALVWDFLKRSFRYFGYEVVDVVNLTDVGHLVSDSDEGEDKMMKASKKEKKGPYEIAKMYTDAYICDLDSLNIVLPKFMPKATDNIQEQLDIIENLERKDFVYTTDDGVYFDVSKLSSYGSLSRQSLEDKKAGARVNVDSEKRNPQDFALWKFLTGANENHVMKWDSKWGVGFPGWHIECSAMGRKYLGESFDIHTGGIEHISVHHENEIAQNMGSGVIKKINYWMHNAHLLFNGEKMSKSLGNVLLVKDLIEKGYDPLAFRELCLRSHYRKTMNFTFTALDSAQVSVDKINEFYNDYKSKKPNSQELQVHKIIKKYKEKFDKALQDDLNTSEALGVFHEFMNETNRLKEFSKEDLELIVTFIESVDSIFGLLRVLDEVPKEIVEIAKKRMVARENKDFESSDRLRGELEAKGWIVKDDKSSKDGYALKRVKNV